MNELKSAHPVLLLILDGFGYREAKEDNAISTAHTPQWDAWLEQGTLSLIDASGKSVGLPQGQMGNSEVGHMHIGAGRVIQQDLSKINHAIATGDFAKNPLLLEAVQEAKANNKNIHIMGLVSPGGVHSHQDHLMALLNALIDEDVKTYIHAFLDGRDTPPASAKEDITRLETALTSYRLASLASVCGRYYAMDRDNRWDRVEACYDMLVSGQASHDSGSHLIEQSYQAELTDEFIKPSTTADFCPIDDGDVVIFFNFRADRARELSHALTDANFKHFHRKKVIQAKLYTMTEYAPEIEAKVLFPKDAVTNSLGECVAKAGLKQLRIAETEKYAHVTFFFNGGKEAVFANEERILVPSPKVSTYDLQPEMSAYELTDKLTEALLSKQYSLIIANFANADMVGHTGNFEATVKAIEALDSCFKRIDKAIAQSHTELFVTADHGNAEKMYDAESGQKHTAHTESPVPFLHIGHASHAASELGSLIDIAPTVLNILELDIPSEMTGKPLIEFNE